MEELMKLVAVSGWKRSGKDTIAEYLIDTRSAWRIGFADPLKEMVSQLFDISLAQINNAKTKEAPLLHMPVLAKDRFSGNNNDFLFGEFRFEDGTSPVGKPFPAPWSNMTQVEAVNKHCGQLYWTPRALCIMIGSSMRAIDPNYWVDQALKKMQPGQLYVLSDVRYKSEMETLKQRIEDLVTVRVNRFETCESQDPSERDLDDHVFDHVIKNEGTLEDLYAKVDGLSL
jgi:hypothetical protein